MKKRILLIFILVIAGLLTGCARRSTQPEESGTKLDPFRWGGTGTSATGGTTTGEAGTSYRTVTVGSGDPVAIVYFYAGNGARTAAVINLSGEFSVVPGIYGAITPFEDGKAIAVTLNTGSGREYRVIDKNGNVQKAVSETAIGTTKDWLFYEYQNYAEGMIPFTDGEHYGFLDDTLRVAVSPKYDEVKPFSEGLAAVCLNDTWQFIDKSGAVVLDLGQYGQCENFSEGLAYFFRYGSGGGYMDKNGNKVIADAYENPKTGFSNYQGQFADGVAPAEVYILNGESGYTVFGIIDGGGKIIYSAPQTDHTGVYALHEGGKFIDGLYPITTGDAFSTLSCGFIGEDGVMAVNFQSEWRPVGYRFGTQCTYENLDAQIGFYENLCAAKPLTTGNDLIGFIDKSGNVVIDFQYYAVGRFSNGLAAVCLDDNGHDWVYIDKDGKTVISDFLTQNGEPMPICFATDFE